MKKLNFATILLSMGMAVIVILGTTNPTSSVISIPAKPVGAVSFFIHSKEAPEKILEYYKDGYIVKTISTASGDCSFTSCMYSVIVMEKY